MRILKFGGTSVADPERASDVVRIVSTALAGGPLAIVVSALAGVTEELTRLAQLSAVSRPCPGERRGQEEIRAAIQDLALRHRRMAAAVASPKEVPVLTEAVDALCSQLHDLIRGIALVGECSARTLDAVLCHGELLSGTIMAAALRRGGIEAEMCDARQLMITDASFGDAHVDLTMSGPRIVERLARPPVPVVTGFIGATPDGTTTTIGRGGSDLTAVLLGAACEADRIEIWTDVDGVLSADPRLVPKAFSLDHLSYDELMELSHFGAKVVHQPAVHPARKAGIPLIIRNTLNPKFPGTRISERTPPAAYPIRGIASIHNVTLIRLQGDGMVGVPGIAGRMFSALARRGISVVLITQASSEHSICVGLAPASQEVARSAIDAEFKLERRAGLVDPVLVESGMSVIAVVGEAMRERIGIAGRIFRILGEERINVRAIAQGSSELNVSLVIASDDEVRALQAIHNAFFAPGQASIDLFLVGHGRVGRCLTDLIATREANDVPDEPHIRLAGVATSRSMALAPNGNAIADAGAALLTSGSATDLGRFVEAAIGRRGARSVVADCTAGEALRPYYPRLLASGVSVVTANKSPIAGPLAELAEWRRAAAAGGAVLAYETTVGSALPMLRTIRNLARAGDSVRRLEGVLSGTLNFLCRRLDTGALFSVALREAYDRGYTEPDPRQDLDGKDMARKLLILCREAGWEIESEAIEIKPFVPGGGLDGPKPQDLWEWAASLDGELTEAWDRARTRGERLCYIAEAEPEHGLFRVGLRTVRPEHPCYDLDGTGNLIAVTSQVYDTLPLVIQGPGAGPELTATGVLADVLGL